MEKVLKQNSELHDIRKNEIQQMMSSTSLNLILAESEVGIANYTKLPVSRLTAYGTAFQPLATAVQTAVAGAGGSGIYYVNTAGKTMFQMKGTNNFIGSLQTTFSLLNLLRILGIMTMYNLVVFGWV